MTAYSSELAEKELLGQACANPFCRANSKIAKNQPGTTIGSGVVKVCKAGRRQITPEAGVVGLPSPAIPLRNKRTQHRVADSRTGRTGSLIEVARILMQQGRQYGASDHDVGETIGGDCTHALSICSPALAVVWSISTLLRTGYNEDSRSRNWIYGDLQ